MQFDELVDAALALVQRRGRVMEVDLRREYGLGDDALRDLWEQLLFSCPATIEERDGALVWIGPPTVAATAGAQRRQITVMFCRLADYPALAGRLDPEELRELVVSHQRVCSEVIEEHGGALAQRLEDGVLAYFGYPSAHEDDPCRAVRAALRIVPAVERPEREDASASPLPFTARVGVHTGMVVVDELEASAGGDAFTALGQTPNVAARVQDHAAPGTVVVSRSTARLIRRDFDLRSLGTHELRGVDAPVELYAVVGPARPRGRIHTPGAATLTPFVGRAAELAQLMRYWDDVRAGRGHAVLLSGEAGIGKSRLVEELGQRLGASGRRVTFRCSPYDAASALHPVTVWLRRQLDLDADATAEQTRQQLERRLRTDGLPEGPAEAIASLLGPETAVTTPALRTFTEEERRPVIAALCRWLGAAAEQHPTLLVCEDLQWADPSTLELVGYWLEHGARARVLALFTFRPEFRPPWPDRDRAHALTVGRLGRGELRDMVAGVVGGKPLPPELLALVSRKTDGVPLFVEELVRMLLETDFVAETDAAFELTAPLPERAIPATLRDSLMARLDRRAAVRPIAQIASVIGREFSLDTLRELSELDATALRSAVDGLVEAGLLVRRSGRPDVDFAFKHALVRDVAYGSLLRRDRSRLHRRYAELLERRRPDVVAMRPELVAHHFGEGGKANRAFDYWLRAARQAVSRAAYREALDHLDRAWALRDTLPPGRERARRELDLHGIRGAALLATRGHGAPEVAETYQRALEACREAGDEARSFPALFGIQLSAMVSGNLAAAEELARRLVSIADHDEDRTQRMQAHRALGNTLVWRGSPEEALRHIERALSLYDPELHTAEVLDYHHDPSVACHSNAALALWTLGRPASALVEVGAALQRAQELAHAPSLAFAVNFVALLHLLRGEWIESLTASSRLNDIADQHGFALWRALGTTWSGRARIGLGQAESGRELLREGIEACRKTGTALARALRYGLLAAECSVEGRVDEGLELIDRAFAAVTSSGEHWYEAELHRQRGDLLLLGPGSDPGAAEAAYRRALELAASQRALAWSLRATVALARLEHRRGAPERARAAVEAALAAMPEDDGSEPHRTARALLAEIGRDGGD